MTDTCYMCDAAASSREHAPPLCIFPETSDMQDGVDYRKNLITVPACGAHNLKKSKDDEYLHLVLVHGYFNNPLAGKQFTTKLMRAFSRRPALLAALHSEKTPVVVDSVETAAVTVERQRFDRCLDMVVRALHFHDFGERLALPLSVHTPLLLDVDTDEADRRNEQVVAFCKQTRAHVGSLTARGSNPEVFWFKIMRNEASSFVACHMCFYGGFDVFAVASQRFRGIV